MKYKILVEDNELFKDISVNDFARYTKYTPGYISKLKNGKHILSERLYNKIKILLTEYRNGSKV